MAEQFHQTSELYGVLFNLPTSRAYPGLIRTTGSPMSSQLSRSPKYSKALGEPPRFIFSHVVHADTHPAHKDAVAVFVIRDIAGELAAHPVWQMEVIDETGKPFYRVPSRSW
jgi:hypothetical protein